MGKRSLSTSGMLHSAEDFEAMYESNAPLIYRFMFWKTQDQALSQDLTSSVFEKAWKTRANFTSGSPKAWLYRIARTTLIDYWRKKKDISVDDTMTNELMSDDSSLDEVLDYDAMITTLQSAVNTLPKEMRTIVQLRFVEGLSSKQVAARLGMSEANVRVIQHRALRKLREKLQ